MVAMACESKPNVVPVPAAPASPILSGVVASARGAFWAAYTAGARNTLPRVLRAEGEAEALVRPETTYAQAPVRLFVTGNMHGEREDCGCRMNPLGGIGRHVTMRATVQGERPVWVDTGDAFFESSHVREGTPELQEVARYNAQTLAKLIGTTEMAMLNVGELDLALGLGMLRGLQKVARVPFVSANLEDTKGELLFEPYRVVVSGGKRVALVGVSKEEVLDPEFHRSIGVVVTPAAKAYLKQARALLALSPAPELLVLVSNQGVPGTKALIEEIKGQGGRVDLALVSNSNRATAELEFTQGTPLLEPVSQGKYVGQVSLWVQGDEAPAWANDVVPMEQRRTDYLKAVAAHGVAMQTWLEVGAGRAVAQREEARLEARAGVLWEGVGQAVRGMEAPVVPRGGADDWVGMKVEPVALSIPQDPTVRQMIQKREKKAK